MECGSYKSYSFLVSSSLNVVLSMVVGKHPPGDLVRAVVGSSSKILQAIEFVLW